MDLPSPLKKAKKIAQKADHDSFQIGAMIMQKNMPLSVGFNMQKKTHPKMKQYHEHKTVHAELAAILKVRHKHNLKGATMVVFRQTKDGKLANSRPCDCCQQILKEYGFKKIIYTINDGWREEKLTVK